MKCSTQKCMKDCQACTSLISGGRCHFSSTSSLLQLISARMRYDTCVIEFMHKQQIISSSQAPGSAGPYFIKGIIAICVASVEMHFSTEWSYIFIAGFDVP